MDQLRKRGRRQGEAGFTLIEVMAGAFMFTIGCLGLLGMMQYSAKANRNSTYILEAQALASSKMSELMALPYGNLANGHNATNVDGAGYGPNTSPANPDVGAYGAQDGFYEVSWTVNGGDFATISVQVRWWDKMRSSGDGGKSTPGSWQVYNLTSAREKGKNDG